MVPHALAWQLLMSFGSRRKQGISEVAGAGARSGWQVRAGRVAGACGAGGRCVCRAGGRCARALLLLGCGRRLLWPACGECLVKAQCV